MQWRCTTERPQVALLICALRSSIRRSRGGQAVIATAGDGTCAAEPLPGSRPAGLRAWPPPRPRDEGFLLPLEDHVLVRHDRLRPLPRPALGAMEHNAT